MNDLQPFDFDGQAVRVLTDENGEPWFVLADLCKVLGIANPGNVSARLRDGQKGVRPVDTPGGAQQVVTVNESGMYSVMRPIADDDFEDDE